MFKIHNLKRKETEEFTEERIMSVIMVADVAES
jgi:hypothetical protein